MDIKDESNCIFTICQGCLSADRKLKCITGQTKALFVKLREDVVQNENDTGGLLLCWECVGLLNKMKYFQVRIKTAKYRLVQFLQNFYDNKNSKPHTLSSLMKTKHKEFDYNFFEEEDNEPIFDQNKLLQKDLVLDQKDLIFEQKEETEAESLLTVIKIEDDGLIKEEYENDTSFNNDLDYYEPELKKETDVNFSYCQKPKKRVRKLQPRIKQYEEFTTVTKINGKFSENVFQYYDTVYVSPRIVEDDYKEKGTHRTGKKLAYRCKKCNSAYVRRVDYLRHTTFSHSQLQYPANCTFCKKEILSESHLEEHWKTHSPMLRCSICGDLLRTKGELTKHLNRMHTKTFACNRCSEEFRTLREFSKHYIMVHERVTCDYCNKNVCSKRKLERHIKRNHIPGHCSICNKDYPTYHLLEKHMRGVHPTLVPHLLTNDANEEARYCVECDKQYPTLSKYKRHLQQSVVHTPRKKVRIPCPACDKIFSRVSYKNNHYRLVHIKKSKHYCELCNKYFANGFGLRQHIQFVHQKIQKPKDKICDLCGRGFSSNRILLNHRRTHTGERPYKCQYCPAAFAQAYAMKTHQKTQHKSVMSG